MGRAPRRVTLCGAVVVLWHGISALCHLHLLYPATSASETHTALALWCSRNLRASCGPAASVGSLSLFHVHLTAGPASVSTAALHTALSTKPSTRRRPACVCRSRRPVVSISMSGAARMTATPGTRPLPPYPCLYCPYAFYHEMRLARHMQACHPGRNRLLGMTGIADAGGHSSAGGAAQAARRPATRAFSLAGGASGSVAGASGAEDHNEGRRQGHGGAAARR